VALSGTMASVALSLLMMVWGAARMVRTASSHTITTALPWVPAALLKTSWLSGAILTWLAPKVMLLPNSQPVPVSPMFLAGLSGLYSGALNLLPVFRLDGGRACQAVFGSASRLLGLVSAGTVLAILSVATSTGANAPYGGGGGGGVLLGWLTLVVLFQRRPEVPCRDEVTDVDDSRRLAAWIVSLVMTVLTLAPFPGGTGVL